MAKFTILTPLLLLLLLLLSWCRLSFAVVGLKIHSLPTFSLKFLKRIFVWFLRNDQEPDLISHKNVFLVITFLLTWCMHIQIDDIKPAISRYYMWQPIANKFYSLNCWVYSAVHKNSVPNWGIFNSFCIEKIITPWFYCAFFVRPNFLHTH